MDLRANTAVDVLIGPFVDKSDGNTTEDGLTLTQAEIKLSKNGQALTQKNDNTSAVFDDDGYYNCELDATDTNTEGNLVLIVHQSANALPIRHEFNVMAEAAWDSLYAAKDTGFMDVNIKAVSEDTVAADNLELQYDTTGLAGDTFPASQSQVGAIGSSAGGALNFEAVEDNSGGTIDPGSTAFVGNETNNYTDTDRENGTYHVITDATNEIVVVYGFNVGGGRTATELILKGFANANNDDLTISVWKHTGGGAWETIGTLLGKGGTVNETITEALLSKHTGTGLEIGKVYIMFNGSGLSASADLNVDQILIEAVVIGQTIGYANGAIWFDTGDGVDGSEDFVNGVADNPCKTIANMVALASSLNLHRFEATPGSSITFGESHTDEMFEGRDWTLALGSRDITGIFVFGARITGIATATAGYEFEECNIGAVTLDNDGHFELCGLSGVFTVGQAGTFTFHNCFTLSGSAVTIDFGALGATAIHMFGFDGEITFKNMAAGDTVHITGGGSITTDSCTAGTIDHDGFFEYTDSGGNVTEQTSDILAKVSKILKLGKNKLEYTKSTDSMVIYDDDGTTPLFTFAMTDNASIAERGAGS